MTIFICLKHNINTQNEEIFKTHYQKNNCVKSDHKIIKSHDFEKYEADLENYTVKCKLCKAVFAGDSNYENHECNFIGFSHSIVEKIMLSPFKEIEKDIKKVMEETPNEYGHPFNKYESPLLDRIQKLESDSSDHCLAITVLENKIKELTKPTEKNFTSGMVPHKCPVCCGTGHDSHPLVSILRTTDQCHACKGEGVLWGRKSNTE